MLRMVVGFMFYKTSVLLVKKNKPAWQENHYNGVGGKCEGTENAHDALVREFREETGIKTDIVDWVRFCEEFGPGDPDQSGYHCTFFKTRVDGFPTIPITNDAGEQLFWVSATDFKTVRVIGNLRWLIPLALDWRAMVPVTVTVNEDIRKQATW